MRGVTDGSFESIEGGLLGGGPFEWSVGLSEIEKRMSEVREVLDETTVEVGKTKEGLYFLSIPGYRPFCYTCNLHWVHLHLSLRDDEAQVFNLLKFESTFL